MTSLNSHTHNLTSRSKSLEISEIFPYLYLSAARNVNYGVISQLRINCIINTTFEVPEFRMSGVEFIRIPVSICSN